MNSLDTNILVYAADADAIEHGAASAVIDEMLGNPEKWIIADQVLFEFYRAIRNSRIFLNPLGARDAALRLKFLQSESGVTRCCYDLDQWEPVFSQLSDRGTPAARTHDIVLGATLKSNGVKRFFTRNTKDFHSTGFEELINPIDDPPQNL
ncbi:MAG: PIN domain-containing protein [Terrimicrobiaceae bacterium]